VRGRLRGLKAVGAAEDQADLIVESFVATVGQAVLDRCDDAVVVVADGGGSLTNCGMRERRAREHQRARRPMTAAGSRAAACAPSGQGLEELVHRGGSRPPQTTRSWRSRGRILGQVVMVLAPEYLLDLISISPSSRAGFGLDHSR
jgi:hypothetical protein